MDKSKVFPGFDSKVIIRKEQDNNSPSGKGKFQAYLFLALHEGDEISPETVKFAPIIVKDLAIGIEEFEQLHEGYNIIGITPLATLIKQMTLLEVFAEKNGYDFDEIMQNAIDLIESESESENEE